MPDPTVETRAWTLADFTTSTPIVGLDPDSPVLGSRIRYESITARHLAAAGVAPSDLAAFADACVTVTGADPDYAAMSLLSHLSNLTDRDIYDDLPLRDAIAWCMVASQENWATSFAVDEFTDVGLRLDGWRFLAAGIEPVEAAILLGTHGQTVPYEMLATMTALRGTKVPTANA